MGLETWYSRQFRERFWIRIVVSTRNEQKFDYNSGSWFLIKNLNLKNYLCLRKFHSLDCAKFIFYFFMLAKKFNSVEDWKVFFLMLTVRLRCVSEISGILTCFMIKMSNFSFSFLGCFSDLFFSWGKEFYRLMEKWNFQVICQVCHVYLTSVF